MPIHTNSIGSSTFQDIVGPVYLRQQQIEIIERPGVDSVGLRNTGTRGRPFDVVAILYCTDFSDAYTKTQLVIALKGSLQTLIRNGTTIGNVAVLEVTESKPPHAVVSMAGATGKTVRVELKIKLQKMPD